jgi:hypothetical protein
MVVSQLIFHSLWTRMWMFPCCIQSFHWNNAQQTPIHLWLIIPKMKCHNTSVFISGGWNLDAVAVKLFQNNLCWLIYGKLKDFTNIYCSACTDKLDCNCHCLAPSRNCMTYHQVLQDFPDMSQVLLHEYNKIHIPVL